MNADVASELPKDDDIGVNPSSVSPRLRISTAQIVCVVAVVAVLGWAYESSLTWLYHIWVDQPDYTHGFLVVPIALVILWYRWPRPEPGVEAVPILPWWPGWLLVVAALVCRSMFHERGMNWMDAATLLPVLIGLALTSLGWRMMLRVWPAFAFLVFLYPLPPQINSMLSQPLQSLATTSACALLRLTGLWVMPEGNVILVGNERLEVAAACNGLSMLMSLAATVAAAASLIPMSSWKRGLLLLSIIPIALFSNVLRIAVTAWCYYHFGADVGSRYVHDWAGWLMMPTAMALVGLELLLMSWLVVESEVDRSVNRATLGLISGSPIPGDRPPGPVKPRPNPGELP
jgi:exosortase